MNAPRFASLAAGVLLASCVGCDAATIHVPGQQPTIQAGIDAASYGDTVLVACGTYCEHDIVMKSGVALVSETGLADCVTIDAEQQGRVIYCLDVDHAASIVGLTITGGIVSAGTAVEDSVGGGIYCEDSSPAITNCALLGNTASLAGGGISCTNSSPTMTDCTFSGNTASLGGGGMFCYWNADPTLVDCTFSANIAGGGGGMACIMGCFPTLNGCDFTENAGDDGGGMTSFMCWPELTDCTFSGNTANLVGGGMTSSESMPTLTDCVFSDNTASELGGGLRVGQNEMATIDGCLFLGNSAERGGGVGVQTEGNLALRECRFSVGIAERVRGTASSRQSEFTNCTFAGNEATYGGGLCCEEDEEAFLVNCTFCLNNASASGGGLHCDGPANARVTDSIIAFSGSGGAVRCSGGGSVTLYCSDVYGNVGGDWTDCIADQGAVEDNFSEDPLFCGPYNLDEPLTLRIDSPCTSDNNPACGLVGAWGVGCDTPVEAISWGGIKAMFR